MGGISEVHAVHEYQLVTHSYIHILYGDITSLLSVVYVNPRTYVPYTRRSWNILGHLIQILLVSEQHASVSYKTIKQYQSDQMTKLALIDSDSPGLRVACSGIL